MNPAIVVSAYNRPCALQRLLDALGEACYPEEGEVILHLSIDRGEDRQARAVRRISQAYHWPHGPKRVVYHEHRLGLLRHFFLCGDLALHYGAIVLLEDDLLVSPQFYNYATQALAYYQHDERIGGVSLYTLWFNGYTHYPFVPMPDASDVFFLQIPYTQGQAFTGEQWQRFKDWRDSLENPEEASSRLHAMFSDFDREDWFPLRTRYLVDSESYYVFPRTSLATGFGDAGTHFSSRSHFFQVPLQNFQERFRMQPLDQVPAIYDSFFEILPERLNRLTARFRGYDYSVDLNGTKSRENMDTEFALTIRPARRSVMNFDRVMWPPEANLIAGVSGNSIHLSCVEDLIWGWRADLAVRKSNFKYSWRHRPLGLREWLKFKLFKLYNI